MAGGGAESSKSIDVETFSGKIAVSEEGRGKRRIETVVVSKSGCLIMIIAFAADGYGG